MKDMRGVRGRSPAQSAIESIANMKSVERTKIVNDALKKIGDENLAFIQSNMDLALFGQSAVHVSAESPLGARVDLQQYFSTTKTHKNFVPWQPRTATEVLEAQKAYTAERVPVLTKIIQDYRKELEAVAMEGLTRRMFELVLKNPPRTMTRSEWKQAQSWLRSARRKITQHLERSSHAVLP